MFDHDRAGPQRLWGLLEEAGQDAILKAFDVDLERIDMRYAGFIEDALQPQRGHLDRLVRGLPRYDVAGAEIVAVGFDHQFAIGGACGGGDESGLAIAGGGIVEREPRMRHRVWFDRDYLAVC